MTDIRKLPISIQDFEDLRTNGCLYVDKTAYIHRLANFGKQYFLGRPRRFGKSLFLSTLKAYFLGKKELFDGLALAELEKEWAEYPVFYIDLNKASYTNTQTLNNILSDILQDYEKEWGVETISEELSMRLDRLIRHACQKARRKVVVLIDEYDKPLTNTLENAQLNMDMREILKGFYGVLKSADAHLRFVFLTGVTKFSQVSIFSDLNQLKDISMDKRYAEICGITETELVENFKPEIQALADENSMTCEDTLIKLKKLYDGYHFAKDSNGMYNPVSLLNTLDDKNFGNYWFATGTPTFLVKMLKTLEFDIKSLENNVKISPNSIYNYRVDSRDPVPILYQSGYLTIKAYDAKVNVCTLGFPNEEVKYGFYSELLPVYMQGKSIQTEFFAWNFVEDLQNGNVDGFMTRLQAFFGGISNRLNNKTEKDFQTIFFLFFRLMGQFVEVEQDSAVGRADAVVTTPTTVYVFEFKLSKRRTAKDALNQIDDRKYAIPYMAGDRQIVKVGVEFSADRDQRNVVKWKMS